MRGLVIASALLGLLVCVGLFVIVVPDTLRELNAPAVTTTTTDRQRPAQRKRREHSRPGREDARAPAAPRRRDTRQPQEPAPHRGEGENDSGVTAQFLILWTAGWTAAGILGAAGLAIFLARRRLKHRKARDYCLYEIKLSMHDQAKGQDLEDMVEAIGNTIRNFPEYRIRDGQPFIAFEMHYGPADHGMEWTLAVRCKSDVIAAIDGAIAAAYPDVRVGRSHADEPLPLNGSLPVPGHVLRYRKSRPFVYALTTTGDEEASAPIEAIAQAQVALGTPSSVRIQLTPAPASIETYARWRFKRHEDKLVRSESWGVTEAGLRGSLNQQEMREAKRTQNKSMFWLELQVAAATREDANRVGAAVQARRGDNVLHRRWMVMREERYRARFPTADPPLWPTPSMRCLVSSAEIAHLLELPSARMKTVPVRRTALPRLPAPPNVVRAGATDLLTPPAAPIAQLDAASIAGETAGAPARSELATPPSG